MVALGQVGREEVVDGVAANLFLGLDAQEAAMGGASTKELLAADTSAAARKSAATPQDHGGKKGKIISVHGQDVFIDIPGGRSQGVLPIEQFPDAPPKVGDVVDVHIEGYDPSNGLLILTRRGAAVVADWSTVAEGMTVEARVTEVNKGGLAVEINGIRGFLREYRTIAGLLRTDPRFRAFHERRSDELPAFYRDRLRDLLGPYADVLTAEDSAPLLPPAAADENAPASAIAAS